MSSIKLFIQTDWFSHFRNATSIKIFQDFACNYKFTSCKLVDFLILGILHLTVKTCIRQRLQFVENVKHKTTYMQTITLIFSFHEYQAWHLSRLSVHLRLLVKNVKHKLITWCFSQSTKHKIFQNFARNKVLFRNVKHKTIHTNWVIFPLQE